MAYTDGKAAGRQAPISDRIFPAPAPPVVSNQELTQGQSAKFRTYGYNTTASNQVRFDLVGKGLNIAGRPSNMGMEVMDKVFPAVENTSKK